MSISKCATKIKPSATLAISAKAKAMQQQGFNVINLSAGEPDFNTPEYIIQAAIKAAKNGQTKYTPAAGTQQLKEAVCARILADLSLNYSPKEIIISSGAKQSIAIAIQALIDPFDEVLIPAPYWLSYPDMVNVIGGIATIIPTDCSFKLSPSQLEASISPKTKLIILNSPNNPSGACYTKKELQALGQVLEKHPNIYIISDDIYEKIYWGEEKFQNIIQACPSLKDRCLIINGTSKAYAMTGWRIGYTAGNEEIIKAMAKIQSHISGCPCSISQAAAKAAFASDQSLVFEQTKEFAKKAQTTFNTIQQIPSLKANQTFGAFYNLINATELIQQKNLKDDFDLAKDLLNNSHVAIIPGSVFGAKNHFRLSFALDEKSLITGLQRINDYAN